MSVSTERKGDYLLTYTGRHFWPLDPRPDEVDILDIAHSLALTNRFGGFARLPYSVAEHSVRMSLVIPREYALLGLMHDAAETYLGDLQRPLKRRCEEFAFFEVLEDRCLDVIFERFKISFNSTHEWTDALLAVTHWDNVLLATEFRDLMPKGGTDRSLLGVEPLPDRIEPWAWDMAEAMFLERFRELTQ